MSFNFTYVKCVGVYSSPLFACWFEKTTSCPVCNKIFNRSHLVKIRSSMSKTNESVEQLIVLDNFSSFEHEFKIAAFKNDINKLNSDIKLLNDVIENSKQKIDTEIQNPTYQTLQKPPESQKQIKQTSRITIPSKLKDSAFLFIERKILIHQAISSKRNGIRIYWKHLDSNPPKFLDLDLQDKEIITKIQARTSQSLLLLTDSNNLFKINNLTNSALYSTACSAACFGNSSSEVYSATLDNLMCRFEGQDGSVKLTDSYRHIYT